VRQHFKRTLFYRQLQVIKTRQFFLREFLVSDHSQENIPVKSASLLFQFTVIVELKTTNEEQLHLRRKVRGKGRNSERE
jgi:hypothetical protein